MTFDPHLTWCSIGRLHQNRTFTTQSKMARFIAQLVVLGAQAIGRAFSKALQQEYQATMAARRAAEEAGRSAPKAAKATNLTGMSLQEAQQILNVKELDDVEQIRKNYYHLFKVNEKGKGGSFYIQSKVVRAKERLELELDKEIGSSDQDAHQNETQTETDSNSKQT